MTALSCGGAPGVAVLGGDLRQLRRRGGRWRLRDWRLRTKLTAVLLVPLLLAGVLGVLRVSESLGEAERLGVLEQQVDFAQQVASAVHDLQRERYLAVRQVLVPDASDPGAFPVQVERVDRRLAALGATEVGGFAEVDGSGSGADVVTPAAATAYRTAVERLSGLPELRAEMSAAAGDADSPAPPVDRSIDRYTEMIGALLSLSRVVLVSASEPLTSHAEELTTLAVAKEQVSHQHAVLLAALLSGRLSVEQQDALRTAQARFLAAVEAFEEAAPPEQQQRYSAAVTGAAVAERERLLDTALRGAPQNTPLGIVPTAWDFAAGDTAERIHQVRVSLFNQSRTETAALGDAAWNAAIRDAVVVAALMILAVLLLILVVHSLLRPLRVLRTHAFDVADQRLPRAVEKLRVTNDKIDETTVEPVPVYSREEVGQVARAFDTVHVQAVRLAAEQAMLRGTLNDIFLNLAGRSQRLVERQLKLIEKLESGEQDPEQLSSLFQLDHLATRMRRNSDNLLVLAGGKLHRGAEREMPVLDLLRAAVSEVAEYRRVSLRHPPAATVTGPVAGDLVHLIAELLDNATTAGPPDTSVTLSSTLTENSGLQIEITDCGTGLPPGELHEINERLASPPVIDVSVSRQMGLFVVSRLASRHRIQVRLRQPRGQFGITASVLLPPALVRVDSRVSAEPPFSTGASTEVGDEPHDTLSGTVWSAQHGEVPLQVSVVEEAGEPDLFSPASIGNVALPRRPQRTAEQEWHDLFGDAGAAGDQDTGQSPEMRPSPGGVPGPALRPDPAVPQDTPVGRGAGVHDALAAQVSADRGGRAAEAGGQVHEEIFEQVSAWFRERQAALAQEAEPDGRADEVIGASGAAGPVGSSSGGVAAMEWQSVADEGWHAANALRVPVDCEVTAAGLPKRRPRAQLVPGAPGPIRQDPAPATRSLSRTPDEVRGRLSSYQQGLRHGRHARLDPDEQFGGSDGGPGRGVQSQQ